MDGLGGYSGWRWIFIIEGLITVVVAVVGWFLIMDFPEQARNKKKFLTPEEVDIMINRVDADRGDAHIEKFSIRQYLQNTLDWKAWVLAANFGLTAIVVYSVAYFLPIVLKEGLHFNLVQAQTLNAPCYVFGGILGFSESWLSDRYKLRAPFILFNCVLEIIGVTLLGFHTDSAVRYFGAYLVVGGGAAGLPLALTYQSNNIVGVSFLFPFMWAQKIFSNSVSVAMATCLLLGLDDWVWGHWWDCCELGVSRGRQASLSVNMSSHP